MSSNYELKHLDYKILLYIYKHEYATIGILKSKFSNVPALEYRLKELSRCKRLHGMAPLPNTSYLTPKTQTISKNEIGECEYEILGYSLTELGLSAVVDSKLKAREDKKEYFKSNLKFPIIVSVVVYVLLRTIELLLPLIQELLSRILL